MLVKLLRAFPRPGRPRRRAVRTAPPATHATVQHLGHHNNHERSQCDQLKTDASCALRGDGPVHLVGLTYVLVAAGTSLAAGPRSAKLGQKDICTYVPDAWLLVSAALRCSWRWLSSSAVCMLSQLVAHYEPCACAWLVLRRRYLWKTRSTKKCLATVTRPGTCTTVALLFGFEQQPLQSTVQWVSQLNRARTALLLPPDQGSRFASSSDGRLQLARVPG